jgi:predicted protein tyrosine phosphatase
MTIKYCTHLNREQAESVEEGTGAVLISITTPLLCPAQIYVPAWEDVLRLEFDDIGQDLAEYRESSYVLPQREHAEQIVAFIRRHQTKSVVAHCEAGISRSAAVCVVLRDLGWQYIQPREHGLERANPLLLALLREAINKSGRRAA